MQIENIEVGEFVKGESYHNGALEVQGLVIGEDTEDLTLHVVWWNDEEECFDDEYVKTPQSTNNVEPASVEKLDQCPAKLRPLLGARAKADTVLVCDWDDAGTPNCQMYREPQEVLDALGDDLDEAERKNLQRQLMEAITDPGTRFETAPGGIGIRFMVIPS